MKIGTTNTGTPYCLDRLDRSILFCGESQQGKTVLAYRMLAVLQETGAAITVLDGAGTLADYLLAHHQTHRDALQLLEVDTAVHDASLRVLPLTTIPTSSFGIDLTKLGTRDGRPETVTERVAALLATLNAQRADNALFNLVHDHAPAALAVLVAAHRPLTELPLLLQADVAPSYLESLVTAIQTHGHLTDPDRVQLAGLLARMLPMTLDVGTQHTQSLGLHGSLTPYAFEQEVGSTKRMLRWATDHPHLFSQGVSTDVFAQPGLTIIRGVHDDPRMTGLLRAAVVGAWSSAILTRAKDAPVPAYLVIDEKEGIDFALVADQLVRATNANAYFWLLLQSATQLGDALDAVLAGVHRAILFRQKSTILTPYLAKVLNTARIDRTYLDTESATATLVEDEGESRASGRGASAQALPSLWQQTEEVVTASTLEGGTITTDRRGHRLRPSSDTWTDTHTTTDTTSYRRGRSASQTRGKERVGLAEQLAALEQQIVSLPPRTAIHVTHAHATIVTHDPVALPTDAQVARARRLLVVPPLPPPTVTITYCPPAPKPARGATRAPEAVPCAPSRPVKANGLPSGRGFRPGGVDDPRKDGA